MELKDKLKQLRSAKGLTQTQLAAAIFVSRSAVAKWENGLGLPGPESLTALQEFYGVDLTEISTNEPEAVIVQKNQKLRKFGCALLLSLLLAVGALSMCLPFWLQSGNYGFTPEMLAGSHAKYPFFDTGDYRIYYSVFSGDWEDGRHWASLSHFRPVALHFWGCTVSESDYEYNIIIHDQIVVGKLYAIKGKNGYYNLIMNSNGNRIDATLITAQQVRINGISYPLEQGVFFVTPEPVEVFWIGENFYCLE